MLAKMMSRGRKLGASFVSVCTASVCMELANGAHHAAIHANGSPGCGRSLVGCEIDHHVGDLFRCRQPANQRGRTHGFEEIFFNVGRGFAGLGAKLLAKLSDAFTAPWSGKHRVDRYSGSR